jgi:predicted nucleotidyltransferase
MSATLPLNLPDIVALGRDQPATAPQIALLTRLAAALRASPDCLGLVLVGSFAKGAADRLSDLDLVAFCGDGAGGAVLDVFRAALADADVLMRFDGRRGPDSPYEAVILGDLRSCEFHVIAPAQPFALKRPYVEVFSRDGCVAARASDDPAPGRADTPVYHGGDRWLPWELLECLKWLSRGDADNAKRHLVRLGRAIEAAAPDAP